MSLINESVADLLKSETSVLHTETEKLLIPKLSGIRVQADYANILHTFYGYFSPLQQAIVPFISESELADIHQRRHAGLILKDLQKLGDAKVPEICSNLPHIYNTASAFGALYVMEGSTLGGRIIANMLKKNSHIFLHEEHLHFFNGYGEATGLMWNHFSTVLNRQHNIPQIVQAANETFLHLKNWMKYTLYAASHSTE